MTDKLNPHFKQADNPFVPQNLKDVCGWGVPGETEKTRLSKESKIEGSLERDMPVAVIERFGSQISDELRKRWNDFQKSKGRYEGSNDLTLLDQFALGEDLWWLAQIIGSCVISNTFRVWVLRMLWEIHLEGQPEEYLGTQEFGPDNLSFYGPYSYGAVSYTHLTLPTKA